MRLGGEGAPAKVAGLDQKVELFEFAVQVGSSVSLIQLRRRSLVPKRTLKPENGALASSTGSPSLFNLRLKSARVFIQLGLASGSPQTLHYPGCKTARSGVNFGGSCFE